jgi:HlyD family secretion protein
MSRTTGRRGWAAGAIGAVAVLALTACTGEEPPPPTLRVDRGPVQSTVSASGTLVAISEQSLGFPRGGQLKEVLVNVGDQVVPGQELARIDDFALRQTLEQEQANLAEAQAELDRAQGDNRVHATGRTLEQAREILEAVKKQVKETNDLNEAATRRARESLEFEKKVLRRAWDRLHEVEERCGDSEESPTERRADSAANGAQDDDSPPAESRAPRTTSPPEEEDDTEDASFLVDGISYRPAQAACPEELASARTAVENAKRAVLSAEAELDRAKHQEDLDRAAGKVAIEREEQTVISAENDSGAARNDRPADIEVRKARLRNAQAAVRVAQQDVDNTVLYAPTAGTVAEINGRVGEFVGDASGTTPVAPGSTARIPDSADLTSEGGLSGGGGGGGGPFMVLSDLDTFQLVVPFEESDAARIAPNQEVEVTVDAVPDLRAPATVLSIAPKGTPSSGIVEYNATIVLREGDARLRDGQTALADVIVESVDNVLRVPSAAVRREGERTLVDVRGADGEPVPTPFEAGAVGDEYTQVLSGLREGQELLLPPAPAASGSSGGGPGGGG